MPKATFRFYEELNDFLPTHRRKTYFEASIEGKRSIKDMIEALGIPHTQIDLILVNGESVTFNYTVQDGDRVSVYPVFESLNITKITRLRKTPLRRTKFIADINLGHIVKYMRIIGFDTYYDPLLSPHEIIEISKREDRIILTQSRKLLKFKAVTHGILIRPGTPTNQVKQIIDTLDIKDSIKLFSRCLRCNILLKNVPKDKVLDRIPPKAKKNCDQYVECQSCDKIYWKGGTHFIHTKKAVRQLLDRIAY
jgi:uncharacterized protein with PIN domain